MCILSWLELADAMAKHFTKDFCFIWSRAILVSVPCFDPKFHKHFPFYDLKVLEAICLKPNIPFDIFSLSAM